MEIGKDYVVIRQPDDWHAHLRILDLLLAVIKLFNIYGRVVCIGNLEDTVDTARKALVYHRLISELGDFLPIIGVMLTKNSTVEEWERILYLLGKLAFIKYMPKGISTNSDLGIPWNELEDAYPLFDFAQDKKIPVLIHAEIDKDPKTGKPLKEIDREKAAVPLVAKLAETFPRAIINIEHVTTSAMCQLIKQFDNLSGGISINNLYDRYEDVCDSQGKIINVHKYAKPIAKKDHDRKAVRLAALSGSKKYFFTSDNAHHPEANKLRFNSAGRFNAFTNLAAGCEFFEKHDALDERFENFFSSYGAERYGFPLNTGFLKLIRKRWIVPSLYNGLVPDMAGRVMEWQAVE